jgi:multidrug resistance efflux pump
MNLRRTQVRSTVNGYVTNLLMRVGDYATAGSTNISIVDTDSFWIDGYFEETKMARIHVGDVAEAKLMGYPDPIQGRVETITRGIATGNASPSTQGLPNVDAVYTWVRLAQRVPVRIRIEQVPKDIPLVAGMTATVTVREGKLAVGSISRRVGVHLSAECPTCSAARKTCKRASRSPSRRVKHLLQHRVNDPGSDPVR